MLTARRHPHSRTGITKLSGYARAGRLQLSNLSRDVRNHHVTVKGRPAIVCQPRDPQWTFRPVADRIAVGHRPK
jgi:hypothetical protein